MVIGSNAGVVSDLQSTPVLTIGVSSENSDSSDRPNRLNSDDESVLAPKAAGNKN
mgnify:CR=1 FL=1